MTDRTVHVLDDVELRIRDEGEGRPLVILHGGGGPQTVAPLVAHLAGHARVLAPTLPGWNGAPRPASLRRVGDIARALTAWLAAEELRDVAVIGSSIGGWLAAELAVADAGVGRITGLVLIDTVGFDVPGESILDVSALDARGVAAAGFHDPDRFSVDPSTLSEEARAAQAANLASLRVVAGDPYMVEPGLLASVSVVAPTALVVWGASDGIAGPSYGRAVAAAFPRHRFEEVPAAGHLPHLERPDVVLGLVDAYLAER